MNKCMTQQCSAGCKEMAIKEMDIDAIHPSILHSKISSLFKILNT